MVKKPLSEQVVVVIGSSENLIAPLPRDHGARGRFTARARPTTAWTSLRLRRRLVGTATGAVAAVVPTIARAVARR